MSRLAGRVTFPGSSSEEPTTTQNDRNPHDRPQNDRRGETQDNRRGGYNNQRNQNPRQNYRNSEHDDRTSNYRNQDRPHYRNQGDQERPNHYRNQGQDQDRPNHYRNQDNRNSDEVKPRGKGNIRYQGNYSDRFQEERPQGAPRHQNQRNERFQKPQEQRYQRNENRREDRGSRSPVEEKPVTHRKPTAKVEDTMPSEELLELEDIIAQISDLNIRSDRSAAQIKRNILASNDLIDTMDESEWEKVCISMISTALDQGEPEFIADLMVALFQNPLFSAVMSDELMTASSKHIMENDDKPIPGLLAVILCAHWPRQYAKAFDNVNPILYTVVCIIKGWIEVVKEDTENFYKEEPKPKYQGRRDKDEPEPEPEEPKEKIIEEPEMVNKCAVALSDLCDTAQRQLWVNWMQVTDEIYQCIKPSITHNPNITGDVKSRLLDTFIQMNQWTKTRQAGIKHAGVQTVSQ